ncbi:MAG: hybrid sensor histidine kinase/response regulator [Deltaproteobacteria bacterium]|nr:hybrid sensor histidine kinase/response regulator [Deltaproteobacteria bacterium]
MRVLIADDNIDLAESLSAVLRSRGAVVITVPDGRAALQQALRFQPDAALIDLKMPQTSGLDVITELCREPRTCGRVIAMTGYDSPERISAAERVGAETVLRKPFSMLELLACLDLDDELVGPEELEHCSIVVVADSEDLVPRLPAGCKAAYAATRERLLGLAGENDYDAVMLLRPELVEELTTDLAHIDPELAVVSSTERALLQSAVRQTRSRRAANRELELLRALTIAAPGALLAVEGSPPRIAFWSAEVQSLLGYRSDELRDSSLNRLEPDLVRAGLGDLVSSVEPSGPSMEKLLPVRVRGGAVRPMRVMARALSPRPDIYAVVLAFSAPELESRHDEDLKVLGATAAGVAHEMRNALAGVGASLTVLQSRFEGTEAAEIVTQVNERVERAAEVMNDLLDFARPVTLRLLATPAQLLLEASADEIRGSAPQNVSVDFTVSDPSLRILVDPVRLQMAVVNLGNNAAQAMREVGGCVTLSCEAGDGHVVLRVDDNGPGIPETIRARIFEPFFTTRARGSGLGLANVRKLVEAHNGRIRLLEEAPGAHFELTLPRRPQLKETS